jgi:predicted kinase
LLRLVRDSAGACACCPAGHRQDHSWTAGARGELGAAFLRIDAIETTVVRCGLAQPPVGPVGYVVAREVAAATLAGTSVVVDALNPVPGARPGWRALASSARLVVFETVLADEAEHRRRAATCRPGLAAQIAPS